MRFVKLFFSAFFFSLYVHAQQPGDYMFPENLNLTYLESLVKSKVDSVRKSYKTQALVYDSLLYAAAKDHANYLTRRKTLSHFQSGNKKKKTPWDRTRYFGSENNMVGENVIQIYIHTPTSFKGNKGKSYVIDTYEAAANDMVKGWIESPDHFKNIKNKDYKTTGLAVDFDPESKTIKAVQVFANPR